MTRYFARAGNGAVGVIMVMLIVLGVTLFALYQRTGTGGRAITSGGAGRITLSPSSNTVYPGARFSTAVRFRTGTTSTDVKTISSVTMRITYSYTGTGAPQLDVVDSAGNPTNSVTVNPALLTANWSFPVKSVTRANNLVTIDVAAIYRDPNNPAAGYSSTTDVDLVTINFKANAATTATLSFDTTQSVMLTKTEPVTDVLGPVSSVTYIVQNDTTAPAAISDLRSTGATTTSVSLAWTAPSDVGPVGKAASYELRYSTSAITAANFSSATLVSGLSAPKASGQAESFSVSGLSVNTPYFFAMKSTDAAGNVSALSNVLSASTQNPNSTFTFGYKLQGVGAVAGKTDSVVLGFGSTSPTYTANVSTSSDANGVFRPTTPFQLNNINLPIGANGTSYTVWITSSEHLRKNMGTVTINYGANTAPTSWDNVVMRTGDFDNNNVLNDTDVGAILTQYTALSIPVNSSNAEYDVDRTGVINIYDISFVLANYTALSVPGD